MSVLGRLLLRRGRGKIRMMSYEGLVRTRLDDPLSLFRPSETPILVASIHQFHSSVRAGSVKNVKSVKYVKYVNDSHLAAN